MSDFARRRAHANESIRLAAKIVLDRVNLARLEREEPVLDNLAELQRLAGVPPRARR